ncbi:hypothetical protein CISIN_1g0362801mg, partial [Citrus sinensis]
SMGVMEEELTLPVE